MQYIWGKMSRDKKRRHREQTTCYIIIIALFAFMKHQRIQYHLSRSAHLQMGHIQNITLEPKGT